MTAVFPSVGGTTGGSGGGDFETPPGNVFGSAFTFALGGRTNMVTLGGVLNADNDTTVTGVVAEAMWDFLLTQDATGGRSFTLVHGSDSYVFDSDLLNTDPGMTSRIRCWSEDGTDILVDSAELGGGFEPTYASFSTDKAANYTLTPDDHNTVVRWDSATQRDAIFELGSGIAEGWSVQLVSKGTGGVRIVPEAGVTIVPSDKRFIGQHRGLFVTRQPESETYRLELGPE